jgi:nucleotidyltransferase substrate binding protein (TIGR01987 family)
MKAELLVADLQLALVRLEDALKLNSEMDVYKAGCIQYFEFTFELAWKSIKSTAELLGVDPGGSPKSCLKTAYQQGWIDDEVAWLSMLEARNRMSHTYDAKDALKVYEKLNEFVTPIHSLLKNLKTAVASS